MKLTVIEWEIVKKAVTGVKYLKNGDPLRDAMDWEDIENAIVLLVKITKQGESNGSIQM